MVSRKRWQDLILPAKRSCVDHALSLTFAETDQPLQVGLHIPTVLLGDQVINAVSAFAEVELNPVLVHAEGQGVTIVDALVVGRK